MRDGHSLDKKMSVPQWGPFPAVFRTSELKIGIRDFKNLSKGLIEAVR